MSKKICVTEEHRSSVTDGHVQISALSAIRERANLSVLGATLNGLDTSTFCYNRKVEVTLGCQDVKGEPHVASSETAVATRTV